MSWHIDITGERQAVKKKVIDLGLPEPLTKLIVGTIHDTVPNHSKDYNGVRINGYGHHNNNDESSLGNIGKLEILPVQLTL